jgi:molecular chaperone GrpE
MFPRKKENEKDKHQDNTDEHVKPTEKETEKQTVGQDELQKKLEELNKQVESLQKEKADTFAKLQRVAADFDNYQKRSSKQTDDSIAYEKDKIIKALLPVMDDFERVLAHKENMEAVVKGLDIVYEHLRGVLKSQGVEEIEATGEQFDPAHHQALTQRTDGDQEDGVVLEELQKGYKLSGRVIRASRVVVNKANTQTDKQAAEEEQPEEETKDTQ